MIYVFKFVLCCLYCRYIVVLVIFLLLFFVGNGLDKSNLKHDDYTYYITISIPSMIVTHVILQEIVWFTVLSPLTKEMTELTCEALDSTGDNVLTYKALEEMALRWERETQYEYMQLKAEIRIKMSLSQTIDNAKRDVNTEATTKTMSEKSGNAVNEEKNTPNTTDNCSLNLQQTKQKQKQKQKQDLTETLNTNPKTNANRDGKKRKDSKDSADSSQESSTWSLPSEVKVGVLKQASRDMWTTVHPIKFLDNDDIKINISEPDPASKSIINTSTLHN